MKDKNKKNGGGKPKKSKITSFDQWAEVKFRDIEIPIGDEIGIYRVHSVTAKQFSLIRDQQSETRPPIPKKARDPESGKPELEDPKYELRLKEYDRALREWELRAPLWFVLEGFVKPNNMEVPGKTDKEKIEELFNAMGIAGIGSQLALEIIRLSKLEIADVNFTKTD